MQSGLQNEEKNPKLTCRKDLQDKCGREGRKKIYILN
jgi:hypothetical protein